MAYQSPTSKGKKKSALGGLFGSDPTPPVKPKGAQNGGGGRLRRLLGRQDPAQRAKEDKIRVDIAKRLRNKLGAQFTEAAARRAVEAALSKERLRKQK